MFDENMSVVDFLKTAKITLTKGEKTPEIYIYASYNLLMSVLQFYSLKVSFNEKPKTIIRTPKQLNLESYQLKYNNSIDEELLNIINMLCKTLEDKLPHVNFSFLSRNLISLKVKQDTVNKINGKEETRNGLAIYRYSTNEITVSDKKYLPHELLHTSNTVVENGFIYSGFQQKWCDSKRKFGIGLNEGYDNLLDVRYFNFQNNIGYVIEREIAKLIEIIVGREKMERLFFTADLNGLIKELECYDNRDSIIGLLKDIDFICQKFTLKKMRNLSSCIFALMAVKRIYYKLLRYYTMVLKNKIINEELSEDIDLHKTIFDFVEYIHGTFNINCCDLFIMELSIYDEDYVSNIIKELIEFKDKNVLVKTKYESNAIRQ